MKKNASAAGWMTRRYTFVALKRYLADNYPEIAYEPTLALKETGKRWLSWVQAPRG